MFPVLYSFQGLYEMRKDLFLNLDDSDQAVSQFFQYLREFSFQLGFQIVV